MGKGAWLSVGKVTRPKLEGKRQIQDSSTEMKKENETSV